MSYSLPDKLYAAPHNYNAVVVLGPTASGKTAFAVSLARQYGGEIISADSRQVYRGMDIGTGKDIHVYGSIPAHLINIRDPHEEYNVFHFQKDVYDLFPRIIGRNKLPIIAGGTGLYLDAVINAYNLVHVPENPDLRAVLAEKSLQELQTLLFTLKKTVHNTTDLKQPNRLIRAIEIAHYLKEHSCQHSSDRPDIRPLILGIFFDRGKLRERIFQRLHERVHNGMIEEVIQLHNNGVSWERLDSFGLEYRFTAAYLQGHICSQAEYIRLLHQAICRFAKRQVTWFRRMERNGTHIHRVTAHDSSAAIQ